MKDELESSPAAHDAEPRPARTAVVVFTRDLRVRDHPALSAACHAERVVPLFVIDDALLDQAASRSKPAALPRRLTRSSMRACANCRPKASCTTECVWSRRRFSPRISTFRGSSVHGTGTDANPHRVFSPTRQAQRFDPDGSYSRRYVTELVAVDAAKVHDPPDEDRARVRYPRKLVEHTDAIAGYRARIALPRLNQGKDSS